MADKVKMKGVETIDKVFVYGTLKRGEHNSPCLNGGHLVTYNASLRGYMFHMGAYPALVLADNAPCIWGEIYSISQSILDRLDYLEGVPGHYTRVAVYQEQHGPVWTYVYPYDRITNNYKVIQGGDWKGTATHAGGWVAYLNDHPDLEAPSKLRTVYDGKLAMSIVKQSTEKLDEKRKSRLNGAGLSIWTAPSTQKTMGPTAPRKFELPEEPDEAYEALDGLQIGWLEQEKSIEQKS